MKCLRDDLAIYFCAPPSLNFALLVESSFVKLFIAIYINRDPTISDHCREMKSFEILQKHVGIPTEIPLQLLYEIIIVHSFFVLAFCVMIAF